MADLSPAAQSVWDAFNQDEPGVFVDYGDKLAAALRAVADQVVPANLFGPPENAAAAQREMTREALLTIAAELEA